MTFAVYRLRVFRKLSLLFPIVGLAIFSGQPNAQAQASSDGVSAHNAPATETIPQLEQEVKAAQARIQELQKELDSKQAGGNFQQQLDEERTHLESIESRLQMAQADPSATAAPESDGASGKSNPTPKAAADPPAEVYKTGYDNGFFIASEDKRYSIYFNGLFQVRYTGLKPQNNVVALGESAAATDTFDVFLGRLAASGSVFQPNIKYFLQMQGSTAGNSNNITLLDWFTSYTFSKYLTLQTGRSYIPYTYEYYDSPGNYLFPDLSNAEYAFILQRAIGFEGYGQVGKLSYAGVIANSVPALDVGNQENFNTKLAYIGHFQIDLLAPYGYVETDPGAAPAKPELTFWGSAAYNPENASSGFENYSAGDTTDNATATIGFRAGYFTLQPTGYFRKTHPGGGSSSNNSWGFGEQAGYYLVAKRLELAERVTGVNWGAPDNPAPASSSTSAIANNWFSGPIFSYHRLGEDSFGLNTYVHGHNAKIQLEYSYLHGNTFNAHKFGANRVELQTQIMF